jgi:monoterpene epsilon-lactone hydrolase
MLHPRFISKPMLAYRRDADPRNPLVSPIHADLRDLPPLLIQVGSKEDFLDECGMLAKKAQQAGVAVTLEVWPEMWHYWHLFVPFLPEARQAIDRIAAFVGAP